MFLESKITHYLPKFPFPIYAWNTSTIFSIFFIFHSITPTVSIPVFLFVYLCDYHSTKDFLDVSYARFSMEENVQTMQNGTFS